MEMDRISDLPRPILHHILSHLFQIDAVKTCVLSKSWRYLWYGRPNVEFCFDHFKGTAENFISVLEETLIRYDHQNLSIEKFILKMPDPTTTDSVFLEKWVPIIVLRNKGLETFHLCFHWTGWKSKYFDWIEFKSEYFDLPSVVFGSESLGEIYLGGFKLNKINNVACKHLHTLRLHYVHIGDETFERIMSSCPLIQEVSLKKCKGLKSIKVNKHRLKNFEYRSCDSDAIVEIGDVSRVETIFFKGCEDWFDRHCNNVFTRLKSLYLGGYLHLTSFSSCNFPCLEELQLKDCYGFEEFRLSSRSIKHLAIETWDARFKAYIDAPNILMFDFAGDEMPTHISFTTTSSKWKSKIVLTTYLHDTHEIDYMSQWLHGLDELLKGLSPSEISLHIRVDYDEDYRRVVGRPFEQMEVVVKHLELCIGRRCSDYTVWLEEEGSPTHKWTKTKK